VVIGKLLKANKSSIGEVSKPFLTELVGYYFSGFYPDNKDKTAIAVTEVEVDRILNQSKGVIAFFVFRASSADLPCESRAIQSSFPEI
jgi:hypothetical protein